MAKDEYRALPMLRSEAQATGSRFYFPGSICVNGHVSKRYTINGSCIACNAIPKRRAAAISRASNWFFNQSDEYKKEHSCKTAEKHKAWRESNPEAAKEQDRIRRLTRDPQKQAKIMRNWRLKNADHVREYDGKYKKQWRLDNPNLARMKGRLARQRRTALERGAEGSYTTQDILNLMVSQAEICATPDCGKDISTDFEIDHIVALIKNGTNWPDNLQLLCCPCNSRKHSMSMEQFIERRKREVG